MPTDLECHILDSVLRRSAPFQEYIFTFSLTLDQVLDSLLIQREDALHFVSDGELHGSFDFLFLLAFLESQDLTNGQEVGVSFQDTWFPVLNFEDEEVDELLDGVSVGGDFEWAESNSALALANEVAVVHVLRNVRVLSSEILELVSDAGLEVLSKGSSEGVAGLGVAWNNGLGKGKDGASLADPASINSQNKNHKSQRLVLNEQNLHWPKETVKWAFNVSQLVEGGVNESVDFLGSSEPGGVSKLLPDGDVSVGGVQKQRDGGHANRWELTTVEGNGSKNWKNLLLNEFVGQEVSENCEQDQQ